MRWQVLLQNQCAAKIGFHSKASWPFSVNGLFLAPSALPGRDLVNILNQFGIPVNTLSERTYGNYQGKNFEFDLIARNDTEVVIVEVKTTLRPADVKHFISKLEQAKTWMPSMTSSNLCWPREIKESPKKVLM